MLVPKAIGAPALAHLCNVAELMLYSANVFSTPPIVILIFEPQFNAESCSAATGVLYVA